MNFYNEELADSITKIGRETLRKLLVAWDNYQYQMSIVNKDARHDDFMDNITDKLSNE